MTFTVRTRQSPNEVGLDPTLYVLEDGQGSVAEVWPALGFNCIRWKALHNGESLELLIETAGWRAMPFSCAADFLACPKPSTPSCLVLDIGLPDLNGLELQHRLAPNGATTPIVFITGTGDIPMTVRAMKAGAVEFFTKPFCDEALLAAIERALQVSRATLRCEAEMAVLRDRYASITRREAQVMSLVVAGLLNKQAAGELGISEITVKAHRGS